MTGAEMIAEERQRQLSAEGWTANHDSDHVSGELAIAAACYARIAALQAEHNWRRGVDLDSIGRPMKMCPTDWPWDEEWWKPKGAVSNLVRAGALIAAEIDRIYAAAEKASEQADCQPPTTH